MNVADKLGFSPKRSVVIHDDGSATVTVTPPKMFIPDGKPQVVKLTKDQYGGYLAWTKKGSLIQNVLSDLSAADRERLLSGTGPDDPVWKSPHPKWSFVDKGMTEADLGSIPYWLNENDPRGAREQLNSGYIYGGWQPFEGFKLMPNNNLVYPGDPPVRPLATTMLRQELIVFYPHSWVAVIQPDRSFEVCRMD